MLKSRINLITLNSKKNWREENRDAEVRGAEGEERSSHEITEMLLGVLTAGW